MKNLYEKGILFTLERKRRRGKYESENFLPKIV